MDDLFGGLPAASNSTKTESAETKPSAGSAPVSSSSSKQAVGGPQHPQTAPPSTSLPVGSEAVKTAKRKAPASSGASVAKKKGISMVCAKLMSRSHVACYLQVFGISQQQSIINLPKAFVPNAIRKKKKVGPQQIKPAQLKGVKNRQAETGNVAAPVVTKKQRIDQKLPTIATQESLDGGNASVQVEEAEQKGTSIAAPHDGLRALGTDEDVAAEDPRVENEPESLRLLHASVTDPYDPHCPNDYLAYKERKRTEQVRKDLQRSAQQRLDQQEKLRKTIEEERRKILQTGDVDKIISLEKNKSADLAGGAGRGRGRGRGLSNLPAWLLKKQQEQNESTGEGSNDQSRPGQFNDTGQ